MMRRTVRVHQWSVLLAIAGCAGESSDAEFRSFQEVDIGIDTDGGSGSMTAGGTTWGGDDSTSSGGGGSFSTSVGSSMSGGDDSTSGGGSFSTSGGSFSTSGVSFSTSDGGSSDDGSSDGGDTGGPDECSTDDDCPLPDDPCRLSACGDDGYCYDYHDTWGCGPEPEVCEEEEEEECADEEYSDPTCPAAAQPAAPAAPNNMCAPGDDVDGGPGREDTEIIRYSRGNNDPGELLQQWARSGMPGNGPQHYVYKTGDITVTTTLERSGCTCMGGMVGGTMEVKTKFEIVNLPVRWQDIMLGAPGNARGWMMFPGTAPTRATRPRLRNWNGYGGGFVNTWWPRVRTYKHDVNVPARKQFQVDNRGTPARTDDIIWDEVTNEVGCGTGEFITRFSMAPRAQSSTNNVDTGLQAYVDVKITTTKNGANVFVSDGESHYLEFNPGYDWTHGGTTTNARKEIAEVEYVTGVAMGNETALTNWLIARETHRDGVAKVPGGSYPNRL